MAVQKLGRNDRCHCGSGRKYKHCCLRNDEDRAAAWHQSPLAIDGPEMVRVALQRLPELIASKGPLAELRFPQIDFNEVVQGKLAGRDSDAPLSEPVSPAGQATHFDLLATSCVEALWNPSWSAEVDRRLCQALADPAVSQADRMALDTTLVVHRRQTARRQPGLADEVVFRAQFEELMRMREILDTLVQKGQTALADASPGQIEAMSGLLEHLPAGVTQAMAAQVRSSQEAIDWLGSADAVPVLFEDQAMAIGSVRPLVTQAQPPDMGAAFAAWRAELFETHGMAQELLAQFATLSQEVTDASAAHHLATLANLPVESLPRALRSLTANYNQFGALLREPTCQEGPPPSLGDDVASWASEMSAWLETEGLTIPANRMRHYGPAFAGS